MSYNQLPRYAPTDLDIPIATAVYEEDYGTTSNFSNARVPIDPNGLSSHCDKLIEVGRVAGISLILFLLFLIIYI